MNWSTDPIYQPNGAGDEMDTYRNRINQRRTQRGDVEFRQSGRLRQPRPNDAGAKASRSRMVRIVEQSSIAVLIALAIAVMLGAMAIFTINAWPHQLTFEERWAPVYEINGGVKGDRLDRLPAPRPQQKQPTMRAPRTRIAGCRSFCEFP